MANNLPGISTYDFCWPWLYKESSNGIIAADLFVYVYNGQPIEPTEKICCEDLNKWGSTRSWLGIQDAPRKFQGPSQEPGPWVGTVAHTTEGVCGLVSQDRWDKVKRLIR